MTANTGVIDFVLDTGRDRRGYVPTTRTDDWHCFTNADRFNFPPFNLC